MDLERRTAMQITYYNDVDDILYNWKVSASIRLALIVSHIETCKNDYDKEPTDENLQKFADIIMYDVKNYLTQPLKKSNE
jgi:hypothetical protein